MASRRGRFGDPELLAVLTVPSFGPYAVSRVAAWVATSMLQVMIAWQVYALTGSPLHLGLIGLARVIPSLTASLVGGAVVDAYDRRAVLLWSQATPLFASIVMLVALATDHVSLWLLYLIVFVTGVAFAFESPARQVVLAAFIPRPLFPKAITVNSTLQSLAAVTGPAVGGALIAMGGLGVTYSVHFALVAIGILATLPIRIPSWLEPSERRRVDLEAIREGIHFVLHRPVLLGAMSLDMFAVIFGGAKALLPVYAVDVLHADALGYGVLLGAMEVGALLTSIALMVFPAPRDTGRALLLSVTVFGLATVLFGLSTSLPLSILAYAIVGMADQFSVVMRLNTIQLSTPDALRGRVTAVNGVFVGASNQIGAVESGLVAAATNAVFAVVSGGVACLLVVALIAWKIPDLRAFRASEARV